MATVRTVVPSTPVTRCAAKDTSRYAINGAVFFPSGDKDKPGWGCATDGRCMVAAPAMVDPGKATPTIPAAALPARVKRLEINGDIRTIASKGRGEVVTVSNPIEGTFPPCDDIVPDPEGIKVWIGLNADLLANLQAALTAHGDRTGLAIGITAANKPILVMPISGDGIGVLMPVTTLERGVSMDDAGVRSVWNVKATEERNRFRADFKAAFKP